MFLATSLIKPILYREAIREEHGLDPEKVIYCCCFCVVPLTSDSSADVFECPPSATSLKLYATQRASSQSLVVRTTSSHYAAEEAQVIDGKVIACLLLYCFLIL